MRIRAFQGLRPTTETASKIAALPYDVVNTAEARALAEGNPLSFLNISRAEINLPDDTDPYSDPVYALAAHNFTQFQKQGYFVRESEPSLYVYQQTMGNHVQKGIVTVSHIEDYEQDIIKKHEKTRIAKENDRLALNNALNANSGPVFLTYRDEAAIDAMVEQTVSAPPLFDFTAPDGIQHTVWRMVRPQACVDAFARIPVAYVADGHHRSASAARAGKMRRDLNPNHTGKEDYNWFLSVFFPASQLKILPYNRTVADLNGLSKSDFLQKLAQLGRLSEDAPQSPLSQGDVSLYLDGHWYGLKLTPTADAGPIDCLDVSMLQDRVLAPLLGIDDPRTDSRVDFIGGIRGTAELVKLVDSGKAAVAFSMYPTTVDQLMAIADAGAIMPPKSTWFEPKLRSGLFIHTIEPLPA